MTIIPDATLIHTLGFSSVIIVNVNIPMCSWSSRHLHIQTGTTIPLVSYANSMQMLMVT